MGVATDVQRVVVCQEPAWPEEDPTACLQLVDRSRETEVVQLETKFSLHEEEMVVVSSQVTLVEDEGGVEGAEWGA